MTFEDYHVLASMDDEIVSCWVVDCPSIFVFGESIVHHFLQLVGDGIALTMVKL